MCIVRPVLKISACFVPQGQEIINVIRLLVKQINIYMYINRALIQTVVHGL
jgi:hypothetical protein